MSAGHSTPTLDAVSNKTGPTPEALQRHRDAQALAYRCAETVGAGLEAGVTEREVARRMRAYLRENGVEDFFHIPFAWFGERTAFRSLKGPWTPLHFFPTNKRLEEGMSYILDCSPVVDGYVSDIGYAGVLGDPGTNRIFDALMRDLAEYRTLILQRIKAGDTLSDVYAAVDALIARQGYESRHKVYPGRVIGHQVGRMTQRRASDHVAATPSASACAPWRPWAARSSPRASRAAPRCGPAAAPPATPRRRGCGRSSRTSASATSE